MPMISVLMQTGETKQVPESRIRDLAAEVYLSGDEGFEEVRALWNGFIRTKPAAVACPKDTTEVSRIVRFARENGAALGVRGGGHNVAGAALLQDGITIDLRYFRAVQVDPDARRVTIGGGVTLAELDAETQRHGFVTPSGLVSETGMAGLALRGGLGHLMRRFGLSSDNLVGAQFVSAEGKTMDVDEETAPDLLWALRGGSENLGVLTSMTFRLYDLRSEVMLVMPVYPAEKGKEVIRFATQYMNEAPRELGLIGFYGHLPADEELPSPVRDKEVFVLYGCYSGPESNAEEITAPLRRMEGVLADLSAMMPYTGIQQVLDHDYPDGMRYYWRSAFLDDMTDEVLDVIHEFGMTRPSEASTLDFWMLGGALHDLGPDDTAFRQRGARYMLGAEANWEDPATDEKAVKWARTATDAMSAWSSRGAYQNFGGFKDEARKIRDASYGPNLDRLRHIKKRYDPMNMFQ